MTRYELHVRTWENCTKCYYSKRRKHVVLGKGTLPCDILFVAEAPGESEDVLGEPMVAQAGRLMDQICKMSGADKFSLSYTNLVGCIPKTYDKEDGQWNKDPEPEYECVVACKPRLEEWIQFANPKMIVTVGKPAKEWFDGTWRDSVKRPTRDDKFYSGPVPTVDIVHPASILRAPFVQRGMMVQQQVVRIRIGIRDYIVGNSNQETKRATAKDAKDRTDATAEEGGSEFSDPVPF